MSDIFRILAKKVARTGVVPLTLTSSKTYFTSEQIREIEVGLDDIYSGKHLLTLKPGDDTEEFFAKNF